MRSEINAAVEDLRRRVATIETRATDLALQHSLEQIRREIAGREASDAVATALEAALDKAADLEKIGAVFDQRIGLLESRLGERLVDIEFVADVVGEKLLMADVKRTVAHRAADGLKKMVKRKLGGELLDAAVNCLPDGD